MLTIHNPDPELADFIVCIFEIHWTQGENITPLGNYCLPTGCSFLGFHVSGQLRVAIDERTVNCPQFYLNKQSIRPYRMMSAGQNLDVVVVALKPTGLCHLLGIGGAVYIDDAGNLEEIDADFSATKNEFLHAENFSEKIEVVKNYLLRCKQKRKPTLNAIDRAVEIMQKENGTLSIADIVAKLNIPQRYFQKLFKKMAGMSPIVYNNIIRLQNVLAAADETNLGDAKSMAALFSYYDAAHYSKAFKKLTGVAPSSFDIAKFPFLKFSSIDKNIWLNDNEH